MDRPVKVIFTERIDMDDVNKKRFFVGLVEELCTSLRVSASIEFETSVYDDNDFAGEPIGTVKKRIEIVRKAYTKESIVE